MLVQNKHVGMKYRSELAGAAALALTHTSMTNCSPKRLPVWTPAAYGV